jgi:hypothetical protein
MLVAVLTMNRLASFYIGQSNGLLLPLVPFLSVAHLTVQGRHGKEMHVNVSGNDQAEQSGNLDVDGGGRDDWDWHAGLPKGGYN